MTKYKWFSFVILAALLSCTQYKNKIINRGYHNLTARYNGYYYADLSLDEAVYKLEKENKEDYSKVIPVFINPDKESFRNVVPELDRSLKKASTCINRHAIKDKKTKQEIPNTGRWIDNCWVIVGQTNFYKREFFNGIEAFEYVARVYKSKEKYKSWLWLIRTYNELNTLSQSEPYITLIKNDPAFPSKLKGNFAALYGEFYLKQGLYDEAIKQLETAIQLTKKKSYKARYNFILGQLYELKKENKKAIQHYHQTVKLKPRYDMVFQSKINSARLQDVNPSNMQRIKRELLRMTKDIKNDEYLDIIYFTLGELEEKEKHEEKAIAYYKTSTVNSKGNNNQKAKGFNRLGEIYFDKMDYTSAEAYYDSTVMLIKEDFPGYEEIVNKKKSLGTLVSHIRNIQREDSLQKIAKMDSLSRDVYIQKIIKKLEEDEQRKKEEEEILLDNGSLTNTGNQIYSPNNSGSGGGWYFYNQQTKSFGINDFIKKWGNRKLEDNWRRSQKALTLDPVNPNEPDKKDTSAIAKDLKNGKGGDPKKSKDYYLRNLPLKKSEQDTSDVRILDSYFALGTIYKEQLNNHPRSIEAFETMNKRFPGNKYEAASYYLMYRMFLTDKNTPKSNYCKDYLVKNHPNSDYAKILNDPDFAKNAMAKRSEVENYYAETYKMYLDSNYAGALSRCNEGLNRYGKNEFSPKLAYLRALCIGRTQPLDSLEQALIGVTLKYNTDPVYQPAKNLLDLIKKQKAAATVSAVQDTLPKAPVNPDDYQFDSNTAHLFFISVPNKKGDIGKLKVALSDFHKNFYSTSSLTVVDYPNEAYTLVGIKLFKSKDEVMSYFNFIQTKNEVTASLKKEECSFFVISQDNFIKFMKKNKQEEYLEYFRKNYLSENE